MPPFRLESRAAIWKKIRQIDLPHSTKRGLRRLWCKSRTLVQAIVRWLCLNRQFCAAVMLGIALAYLLHPLPWVGPVLATLSLSLSLLYGLAWQFRSDLERHFHVVIEKPS